MASMTFDLAWKEAMVELLDQLQEMDPEAEGSEAFTRLETANEMEKFQMYATLYIRYLQIFRALEESYDMTVHPQKRIDIKKTLEAVMGRVLEVKETLVTLKNGVNFINLDDVLVDLKLTPDVLEVPVPKFFIEDQGALLEQREQYLDVLLKEAGLESKPGAGAGPMDTMTLESAIRVVQLNERGRQGRQRAKFMKEIRAGEERERCAALSPSLHARSCSLSLCLSLSPLLSHTHSLAACASAGGCCCRVRTRRSPRRWRCLRSVAGAASSRASARRRCG